jgi:hypothetical protein
MRLRPVWGVVRPQPGLADFKSTLVQGPGTVQIALAAQDVGDVVQAPGGVGVVVTKLGLANVKGTLVQRAGTVQVALVTQD